MKRALVLGARAPACLEWARALAAAGWRVAAADSLALPLTRASRAVADYHRLPEPARDVTAYGEALAALVRAERFDLVLPTCEEAFFLAHQRGRLPRECLVLVDDFEKLAALHHKGVFARAHAEGEVRAPETHELHDRAALLARVRDPRDWVLKPAFSRFATHTHVAPSAATLAAIAPTPARPWVAQRRIAGDELCSYSVLRGGRLVAHACYRPRYRVGKGSGMYFEARDAAPVRRFVEVFGARHGYEGQVGFDFVEQPDGQVFVLECNPRATSGIHLLGARPQALVAALLGDAPAPVLAPAGDDRMVAMAMALFGVGRYAGGPLPFWADFKRTPDVIHRAGDPWPQWLQLVGLAEVAWRALQRRLGLLAAATADIEWNGDPLGPRP